MQVQWSLCVGAGLNACMMVDVVSGMVTHPWLSWGLQISITVPCAPPYFHQGVPRTKSQLSPERACPYLFFFQLIYLAVPSHSCGMRDSWSSLKHAGYLTVACGILFPDQGSNLDPLHWEFRVLASRKVLHSYIFINLSFCIFMWASLSTLASPVNTPKIRISWESNHCSSVAQMIWWW